MRWQIKVETVYQGKSREVEFFQADSEEEINDLMYEMLITAMPNETISGPFPVS